MTAFGFAPRGVRAALAAFVVIAIGACSSSSSPPAKTKRTVPVASSCWKLNNIGGVDVGDAIRGPYSNGLVLADFDGDGKLDLAAPDFYGGAVAVLRGKGDGTFGAAANWTVAGNPLAVAAGDLDGDGKRDLVVATLLGVSTLRGNGDGTFQPEVQAASGWVGWWVTLHDLDGDKRPDLLVNGDVLRVLLNKGDGTFAAPVSLATASNPHLPAVGDLDGDGVADLVVPSFVEGVVSVLRGLGHGTFAPAVQVQTGAGAASAALADLDGDGLLDLVVANYTGRRVSVLVGKGDGTFGAPTDYDPGDRPYQVALVDADQNGTLDIVTTLVDASAVSVLLGDGTGAFSAARTTTEALEWPVLFAVADVDGDGRPDLVAANSGWRSGPAYSYSVLRNSCAPAALVLPAHALTYPGGVVHLGSSVDGLVKEAAWSLPGGDGSLSATAGSAVDYTATSTPGALRRVEVQAAVGSLTAKALITISPRPWRPVGFAGAPSAFIEYLPAGYGSGPARPLLVALHGSGATPADWGRVGGLLALDTWPSSRPFVVLAPQHVGDGCFAADEVQAFLAWALAHYQVDPKQVFLVGESCGAMGTWAYLAKYLDTQVAAAVVVCGDPGDAFASKGCDLGKVAIWALHGDRDPTVPFGHDKEQVEFLIACPSPPRREVKFTTIAGGDHGIYWDLYTGRTPHDLFAWLLANGKP